MRALSPASRLLVAFCMLLGASGHLAAQQAQPAQQTKPFQPAVGQPGKDVVWVPTPQALVNKMLDMAKVTPQDFVMDLGSGDGRTVITAAKRGTRALGIEYNPDMVELSKVNAAKEGVSDRATFVKADLFATDLSQATVITMFLLPEINLRLRPKLLALKPGTRVVSNSFDMGEWAPDETATLTEGCSGWCTAYLWIVPAKVDGMWQLGGGDLTLRQEFQALNGQHTQDCLDTMLTDAKIVGDEITFTDGDTVYKGRVEGDRMKGTAVTRGVSQPWIATRE